MAAMIYDGSAVDAARPLATEAARLQAELAEAGEIISTSEALEIVRAVQAGVAGQRPQIVARLAAIHRSQRGRLGFVLSYSDAVSEVQKQLSK